MGVICSFIRTSLFWNLFSFQPIIKCSKHFGVVNGSLSPQDWLAIYILLFRLLSARVRKGAAFVLAQSVRLVLLRDQYQDTFSRASVCRRDRSSRFSRRERHKNNLTNNIVSFSSFSYFVGFGGHRQRPTVRERPPPPQTRQI